MQLQQYSIELWEEPDTECQHGVSPVRNARLEHPAKTFLASGFASFAILQVTCRSSGGLIIGNKAAERMSSVWKWNICKLHKQLQQMI